MNVKVYYYCCFCIFVLDVQIMMQINCDLATSDRYVSDMNMY